MLLPDRKGLKEKVQPFFGHRDPIRPIIIENVTCEELPAEELCLKKNNNR